MYTIYFVFDLDGECKFIKTEHYSDRTVLDKRVFHHSEPAVCNTLCIVQLLTGSILRLAFFIWPKNVSNNDCVRHEVNDLMTGKKCLNT